MIKRSKIGLVAFLTVQQHEIFISKKRKHDNFSIIVTQMTVNVTVFN